MSEEGKIGFADVQRALIAMRSEGGRFFGMMERQSQTLEGRWSTLVDSAKRLATEVGERLMPAAKRVVEWLVAMTNTARALSQTIGTNSIKIVAFAVAWAGTIAVGVRIVKMIGSIVGAMRALAGAQTLVQALSGPRGWATVAAGLVAAVAAAKAVDAAFAPINNTLKQTSEIAAKAEAEVQRLVGDLPKLGAGVEAEKTAAAMEKQAEAVEKYHKSLQNRADSIRESLRNPVEIMADTIRELKQLSLHGIVDHNTLSRGIEKAKDDLRNAIKNMSAEQIALGIDLSQIKELGTPQLVADAEEMLRNIREASAEVKALEVPQGVGAAVRGTTAGFSAVLEGHRTLTALTEQRQQQERQAKLQENANGLLQKIIDALQAKKDKVELEVAGI
jgi:hypothetical protein